jgi:hypothetical protein
VHVSKQPPLKKKVSSLRSRSNRNALVRVVEPECVHNKGFEDWQFNYKKKFTPMQILIDVGHLVS